MWSKPGHRLVFLITAALVDGFNQRRKAGSQPACGPKEVKDWADNLSIDWNLTQTVTRRDDLRRSEKMKHILMVLLTLALLLGACTAAPEGAGPTSEGTTGLGQPEEMTQPPADATQPMEATEPPAEATQPMEEATEPMEATQPMEESTQPVPETGGDYQVPEGALAPVPLESGSQATGEVAFEGDTPRIAYMPPATEFNYYMAIGAGIEDAAEEAGAETFMLAPQSGSDIAGQMTMIQDVITQGVDAIILSTHDEQAAAPLVKQAVDNGIAVVIVNSDIAAFPTPVHAVVGYSQRRGTFALGEYAAEMVGGEAQVGVLEGLPGYHSTERIGGFLDAFANYPGMEIVASLPTEWNVETGNTAMTDLLQAHPDVNLVVAANDYIAIGAARAAEALGREDVLIFGNDGDTTGLEDIAAERWTATVNTTPYVMGKVAFQVTMDVLNGTYPGGWTETPTVIADASNAETFLCQPENLFPAPAQEYTCP